ncbi:MAG: YceD family protein [Nannocystaceae bacterium]
MTTRSTIQTSDEPLVVDLSLLSRLSLGPHPLRVPIEASKIAAILASTDAEVKEPGLVDLELLVHSGESVLVRGAVEVALQVPCARCLEPARVANRTEICVNFVKKEREIPASASDDDESELDLEAPEEMTYSGTILDLRPLVDENVGLAYPMRALCALGEACRGLCHACGRNLNLDEGAGCPECRGAGASPADLGDDPSSSAADRGAGAEAADVPAWKAALKAIKVPSGGSGRDSGGHGGRS